MEAVDVVGVVTLIALNLCYHHLGVHNGIFAETLIDTWPTGVTAQVNNGVIYPGTVGSTTFVGCYLGSSLNQFRIKRGTHIDRLGEQSSTLHVGDAVVMVETIDIGDAEILHRLFLNKSNPLQPLVNSWSTGAWGIENRTHLPFGNKCVEHGLVQFPYAFGVALVDVNGVVAEFLDNLFIGLLQQFLQFCFRSTILLHD